MLADADLSGEPLAIDGEEWGDFIVSKLAGGEGCQPQRVVRAPDMPSQTGIDEHGADGHATYRAWRGACVEGPGIGNPPPTM